MVCHSGGPHAPVPPREVVDKGVDAEDVEEDAEDADSISMMALSCGDLSTSLVLLY
jgi:hypothetical protein